MFQSILGEEICEDKEKNAIFQDFNLDVCISEINSRVKGHDLQKLYQNMPKQLETIKYRRSITGDLLDESLRRAFLCYSETIDKAEKCEKNSIYSNYSEKREKWHLDALCLYVDAVEELYRELEKKENVSEAMQELVAYLAACQSSEKFKQTKEKAKEMQREMAAQPAFFTLQKNKVIVELEEAEETTFAKRMMQAFCISETPDENRRTDENQELSLLERNLAKKLIKLRGWEKNLQQLMKQSMDPLLIQLAKDIHYYLGFFALVQDMEEKGYTFCMPVEGESMRIQSGYDAAMAIRSDKPVIKNDFHIEKGERFFVITGANGGGKTTFARMIGQILYFCRMGLLVPCEQAVIPHYEQLLSHFSNEESEISGRGKLVEELERLQPMMKKENKNSFVILNELFTTAATLDAGIMGQKVLDFFMDTNCSGIYVTHIQSLAEERQGVVSMVAELEKDHHTRSFKITRKPAKDGEYEDSLITKYHMTYEQMKAVIGHGD